MELAAQLGANLRNIGTGGGDITITDARGVLLLHLYFALTIDGGSSGMLDRIRYTFSPSSHFLVEEQDVLGSLAGVNRGRYPDGSIALLLLGRPIGYDNLAIALNIRRWR